MGGPDAITLPMVVTLLVARQHARNPKGVSLNAEAPCLTCGQRLGEGMKLLPTHVQVSSIEWTPTAPPRAVVWLDEPVTYGGATFDRVIVSSVTWATVFGGASLADMANRERMTVRAGAAGIVGYLDAKGAEVSCPMPVSEAERLLGEGEFDRLAEAVYACSAGASIVAAVPHSCGGVTLVPFDLAEEGLG